MLSRANVFSVLKRLATRRHTSSSSEFAYDLDALEKNIKLRHHPNNIPTIRDLLEKLKKSNKNDAVHIQDQLNVELSKLPNRTHERLLQYGEEPKIISTYEADGISPSSTKDFKEFSEICKKLNLLRMDHLGNYTGHKSYYLLGALALLEQALIQYTVNKLQNLGFALMAVPDILNASVIEGCGMQTQGERTQVYKLDSGMCLSGTAEMALAGFFKNKQFTEKELPLKVCAVSRCYRAETSNLHEEKGIYRVHQFTKVEMFALCNAKERTSNDLLESFREIEMGLYKDLQLNFRVLDMSPNELGAPAYQKYDIETWMPGRKLWGELSSCSNCTDYQAKRLNIQYCSKDSQQLQYVQTLNGTAAAIPRLLIAIIESNQKNNGLEVAIPTVLQPYMNCDIISRNKKIPEIKLVKHIKSN